MEHAMVVPHQKSAFDAVENYLSAWIMRLQKGDWDASDTEMASQIIQQAGIYAMREITEHGIPFNLKEMVDLLVRKQNDYGHGNINNFGVIGIAVRACDKIARIKNLQERNTGAQNEPLNDSYVDLVGYATIAGMYQDGTFQLKLKGDTNG
jgi:hypothetical protein